MGWECSYKLVTSKLTKLVGFFDYSRATLAGVCGKPSDQIRCRSQPNQLHVRSNPIPEFSGYYGGFCHYPPVGRCIIPIFALGWHRQIV